MALPNVPFGIVASGVPKEYIPVKLYASHAAVAIGDIIYATTNGNDKLADNTAANQTRIVGISTEKVAASSGKTITCINPHNQEFEAQALTTGDNYLLTDIGAGVSFTVDSTPDSRTGISTGGITAKAAAGAGIITGFGQHPGNALDSSTYPIIRFKFRLDRLFPYTAEI